MAGAALTFDILARDKASPTIDKVGKKVEGLSTRTVAFGSFIGNAMSGAVGALGRLGVSAAKMGITTAAGLEQAQVGFTTLIGNGKKAQQFLGQLQKFAAATPFELPGLIDSSRLLLGVGVSADKVIPTLTAFGDAAGAVGVQQDAFQRIILATTQAISAGRFQVGDLNQIVTNGIPAWKLLSEATGKPVPVLRDLASKGKLLAADVLPALQKQMEKDYGGAMAKQSLTLAGVWSTLMDTLNIGLANVLKPLVPWLERVIPKAANILQAALQGAGQAVSVFVNALSGESSPGEFAGSLKAVNQAGIAVRATYQTASRMVGNFVTQMQNGNGPGGTFVRILGGVRDTAQGAYGFLKNNSGVLKGMIGTFIVLNGLLKAYNVAQAISTAGSVSKAIWEVVKAWQAVQVSLKIATALQWAYNVALAFFEGATGVGLVLVALGALTAAFIYLWTTNEGFRRVVEKTWHAIVGAIGSAVDWITGTAWPAVVGAWDAIAKGAVDLWHATVDVWDKIVGAVESGVHGVLQVGRGIGSAFMEAVSAIGDAFGAVGHVFATVGQAIATALAPVGAAVVALYRFLQPVFTLMGIGFQIVEKLTEIWVKTMQIMFILLGRAFSWLGGEAMKGLRAIGDGVTWLGSAAMKGLRAIGDGATWLYSKAIAPALSAIAGVLRTAGGWFVWLWQKAGVPALHGIEIALHAVGTAMTWLWRTVAIPVFNAIAAVLQAAWNKGIRPVLIGFENAWHNLGDTISLVWRKGILAAFNALKDFVQNKIAPAFKAGVKAIGQAWDDLKSAAKKPIEFVVTTVINHGIIDTFNTVAAQFGVSPVGHVKLPKDWGMAKGGVFNRPTAIVGEGGPAPEYVIPTDPKYRKRALGLYEQLGTKLMASGGIVGWLTDPLGSMHRAAAPWLDQLAGISKTPFGRLAAVGPRMLADSVGHFLLSKASAVGGYLTGGGGTPAVRRVGQRLAAVAGYSSAAEWSALDALWTHESNWNPRAKNPTSTAFGIPQFLKSTAQAYGLPYGDTDPIAQIKAGLKYIRDVYGDPINAWAKWQSRSPHWYGAGGTITEPIVGTGLRTGRSYGFGEHGPETVIPGRGGGGDIHVHLHVHGPVGSSRELQDWLARAIDQLRSSGRLPKSLRTA